MLDEGWVPAACTLPTAEQPLRAQEFDTFFAEDALGVTPATPDGIAISVRPTPEAAARAARLAIAETACCSFFTFELTIGAGAITLTVTTEPGHAEVLAALGARAHRLVDEAHR